MKKKGFGAGRWNGFGGKVEEGETVEEAAVREVQEEAGLEVIDLEKRGILEFTFESDKDAPNSAIIQGGGTILEVHVFKVSDFKGKPQETDEMKPQWFYVDEIPFKEMWSSDVYWLPMFLKGRKFRGKFHFDAPSSPTHEAMVLDRKLAEVDEI